jgi:hypothetical protein
VSGGARGERIADEAWAVGDHRPRCVDQGHLVCRGCDACACIDEPGQMGMSAVDKVRVTTDKEGRTWCQECRYENTEYGNWRTGADIDDRPSRFAAKMARVR